MHAPILALANDPAGMLSQHYSESIDDHRKVIIHCCMDANRLNIHNASSYLVKPIVAQVVADSWSRV